MRQEYLDGEGLAAASSAGDGCSKEGIEGEDAGGRGREERWAGGKRERDGLGWVGLDWISNNSFKPAESFFSIVENDTKYFFLLYCVLSQKLESSRAVSPSPATVVQGEKKAVRVSTSPTPVWWLEWRRREMRAGESLRGCVVFDCVFLGLGFVPRQVLTVELGRVARTVLSYGLRFQVISARGWWRRRNGISPLGLFLTPAMFHFVIAR